MNKVIGYSRKSTSKQSNADGVEALKQAGCEIVFEEIVSTRKAEKDRPELMKCLASLRKGDTLKLTSLSRLGRTQREVINRLHELQAQQINVITLDGLINLGWEVEKPKATMFVWAKIPKKFNMKSMEFSELLLKKAKIAVSPGLGFGVYGDDFVRFSLIENEHRTKQALKNLKKIF